MAAFLINNLRNKPDLWEIGQAELVKSAIAEVDIRTTHNINYIASDQMGIDTRCDARGNADWVTWQCKH